ncbi:P-loop containing nucleoside triphosphate hydrolase protein [Aspergillus ambiguus]|uniref:P-loop containing nucleoside triphosphate hydrolase protein n=1 Tax=Aspergillus ambiguus TaxID=176160 RepID=UPI003CCD9556
MENTRDTVRSTLNRVIEFVLPLLDQHLQHQQSGSGKSTLASALYDEFRQRSPSLQVAFVSLDGFYLKKDDLDSLSRASPGNKLVSVRGPPGTHDVHHAAQTLKTLAEGPSHSGRTSVTIPIYDKGAFKGRGDRLPPSEWRVIQTPVNVVIFEGWCLGFRHLPQDKLEKAISDAIRQDQSDKSQRRKSGSAILLEHSPEHLCQMNEALRSYTQGTGVTAFTDAVDWDAFIQLDTIDLQNVYRWRWEQEARMRAATGKGMTEEEVKEFIDKYMPSYYLYIPGLREGVVSKDRQLRLILGRDRTVTEIQVI